MPPKKAPPLQWGGFEKRQGFPGSRTRDRRSAYTLLEVILALALTTVILGLIGMAIHVHLGVADKSRGQVEEAQLARALLQRIAEDLRNTVPFTATTSSSGSSTGGTDTSPESEGLIDLSTAGGSATAGGSSTTSEAAIPSGIYGNSQCLQMDTSRRVRPIGLAIPAEADSSQVIPLSDAKTVTYSLGDPGTTLPTQQGGASSDPQGGLYRREMDRAQYASAMQQGQTDILNQATKSLASEVVDMRFTYYDGQTAADEWDSGAQGKLPIAVKVTIMLRRAAEQSSSAGATAAAGTPTGNVYEILVDLPNSEAQATQTGGDASALQSPSSSETNTPAKASQPTASAHAGASTAKPPATSSEKPPGNTTAKPPAKPSGKSGATPRRTGGRNSGKTTGRTLGKPPGGSSSRPTGKSGSAPNRPSQGGTGGFGKGTTP